MASSNIKLFDENKGNMLNDTEFKISTQRLNGLQTGVASSQLQNKAMYQASLMAYSIAQLMLANGQNAKDTDAVSTFVNNLLASIVQKVADKATEQDVVDGVVGKWISSELLKSNNEKIDAAMERLKPVMGTYIGDGKTKAEGGLAISLGFRPSFVIIQGSRNRASEGYLVYNCVLMPSSTDYADLTDSGFIVFQTALNDAAELHLNTASRTYNYAAFR